MAGTITLTTRTELKDIFEKPVGERLLINWTGDASDGSVPNLTLRALNGFLHTFITNPGATAPTDNYDIALYHPSDSTADILGGTLADRDTTNTEIKPATVSGSALPVYVNGNYTLTISNNAVNSATGVIIIELLYVRA